jgi:transcriptional regulator with GAF, ATPase, and Fis domain
MEQENGIFLCLDATMPAAQQVMRRQSLAKAGCVLCSPATAHAPPALVVCMADAWSASFVQQVLEQLERCKAPTVVAVCQPSDERWTQPLMQAGVWNVVTAPDTQSLVSSIHACAVRLQAVEEALASAAVQKYLVGASTAWRAFLRELIWAAKYSSAAVLLHGETGTGKELLARLVHTLDEREDKGELVVVDCTTLSTELAASELFGHERGAFTGAQTSRTGAAALADRGTLFLDEVGELSLPVQAQLLRLLQEGTYKTVGGNTWKRTQFRLVCATHRDLREAVAKGTFRQDLYFRISGWTACVPALRKRPEDIPEIANHFLREFGCQQGMDEGVAQSLKTHRFEGNVRELRQLMMQSAVKHCGQSQLSLGDLPLWWHQRQHAVVHGTVPMAIPTSNGQQPWGDHSPQWPAAVPAPIADTVGHAGAAVEDLIGQWVREGMGLREITQRAGDLAVREALQLEQQQVGKAARRLGVTERAIQLRRAQRPETDSA